MINKQLLHPESIVVVGASNNVHKPGGAVLRNLIEGGYDGRLSVINPKEDVVQGIDVTHDIRMLPPTDLAILVVPAKFCGDYVETLAAHHGVRAFIILSAGFGEESREGAQAEQHIVEVCNRYGAALIGPNCIGLLTTTHHSVFTQPIPTLSAQGVDLISGSGATAVFIIDSAVTKGLAFNSVWSVGNGKQIGIEDVLEYMDEHFDPARDSHIKLLYIENIAHPQKLLLHASSLIRKGCRIAAIKAGASESGSRAASSHTGAIATNDVAVDALMRKAGIVRCHSREELTTVGCVFTLPPLKGRNIAVITHAGGPGVMLTDALSKGGMNVPPIAPDKANELKQQLFDGSSVSNPIDILATGTAEQLDHVIDYCEHNLPDIDAMCVIWGTPGLTPVFDAYEVIHRKMEQCSKPIYPVMPSTHTAAEEIAAFLKKGHVFFSDEVNLAKALVAVSHTSSPTPSQTNTSGVNLARAREIIKETKSDGYLAPDAVGQLLQCAGIDRVKEIVANQWTTLVDFAQEVGWPIVAKVVGPVHKSDVGGVVVGIDNEHKLKQEFERMMAIPDAKAVMVQPMLKGTELFVGAKYNEGFGHTMLCGAGGIFVEVLKDVASAIAPVTKTEALHMLASLRSYKLLQGVRGQKGVNMEGFANIVSRLSVLLAHTPEIKEMDINPLIAHDNEITAVDARIRIERE